MGRWPADWPESVHLIGVGGVAMSGLAAVLAQGGSRVRGSDRAVYPPASTMLEAAGIELRTPFDALHLSPAPELVVVGNAISRGNVELEHALSEGLALTSLPEVIERLLVPQRRVTVIAGTHGKTTATSMSAWLHHAAGHDPTFLIGGQPGNFDVGARLGQGRDLILEGDEYDSAFFDKGPKFLHYWPDIAVLGPVEYDHADIYADLAAVERAFALYLRLLPDTGTLIVHDHPGALALARDARARVIVCGLSDEASIVARDRIDNDDGQSFTLVSDRNEVGRVRLALAGEHNARNALGALAAAAAADIPLERGVELLAQFRGPKRRLEKLAAVDDAVLYDDFAHHPTAVDETLRTLRQRVPSGGRLVACLEPRSNTMVRSVWAQRLEDALSQADLVLLGPIDRPERFQPGEALDIAALVQRLRARGREAHGPLPPGEIADAVSATLRPGDRVVVMSNGAFGGLAHELARRFALRAG